MPFYLEMSKNITKQRDIYDTVIFRFLQIFYLCVCLHMNLCINLHMFIHYVYVHTFTT